MRNVVSILLLFLWGCQTNDNFILRGQLPDQNYDGEIIYLVPLENAGKERVDSTIIKNGSFQFKGFAPGPEIYIIRAKPVLRFNLEELLVVKEAGELQAVIDRSSFVGGTALNDSLQHWKEKKMLFDKINAELVKRFRLADEVSKSDIQRRIDSLSVETVDYHFNFVRNNHGSVVGQFVLKMMAGSFNAGQKKILGLP